MHEFDTFMNDEAKKYITSLAEKLTRHFDLFPDETKCGEFFDLYAFHQQNFHKSFITKSTVYEGFSVYEHMCVRILEHCTEADLSGFQNMLKEKSQEITNPHKMHKRSIINGILICADPVSETLGKAAAHFFHRQNYKFCFHGWSETMTALVSLTDKKVYFPKRNKNLGKLLSF